MRADGFIKKDKGLRLKSYIPLYHVMIRVCRKGGKNMETITETSQVGRMVSLQKNPRRLGGIVRGTKLSQQKHGDGRGSEDGKDPKE